MSNIYYNPSGNPGTRSDGLSSLIRAEFAAIGLAFDMIPQISTTGLYATVFNQQGNYTFTLPSAPGTLALTADVATETSRATTAEALLAPKASPALTGTPTGPTAAPGTNTTQLATTAFDTAAVAVETARATAAEALLAPLASPALTGTPTAPTASAGTNTTQVSTTAFVTAAITAATPTAQFATVNNVSSSRALNTTYTNSTGKVMFVSVQLSELHGYLPNPVDINISVNGVSQYYNICNTNISSLASYGTSGTAIIPPLSTYKVTSGAASPTIIWTETW